METIRILLTWSSQLLQTWKCRKRCRASRCSINCVRISHVCKRLHLSQGHSDKGFLRKSLTEMPLFVGQRTLLSETIFSSPE